MHGLFPEVMVNPEDSFFVESAEEDLVELLRGDKVGAERLFDDDASTRAGTAGFGELLDNRPEHVRRDGQIKGRPLRAIEFLAEGGIGRWVGIIPADITQQAHEFLERRRVNLPALFQTLPRAGLKGGQIRRRAPDAD